MSCTLTAKYLPFDCLSDVYPECALQLRDSELVEVAVSAVRRHLGITSQPQAFVKTWTNRLPQYTIGHLGEHGCAVQL